MPIDHSLYNELLGKNVTIEGSVYYPGFIADSTRLNEYLNLISQNPPSKNWSQNERMAYWINAYNAFTIQLIIRNYPLKSIQELHPKVKIPGVATVWHKKFFKIGDREMSLNQIEHKILRKEFMEPRIHFAINCASKSCPRLLNEAFTAINLEDQLTQQTREFLADETKNRLNENAVELSQIFNWFKKDFTENGSVIDFINQFSVVQVNAHTEIGYMTYDWSLND